VTCINHKASFNVFIACFAQRNTIYAASVRKQQAVHSNQVEDPKIELRPSIEL